jgi:carboxyl-terminal processing protease
MGNKKIQAWLPLLFSITMIMGILIGYQIQNALGYRSAKANKNITNTTDEVLAIVNEKYVDKINADTINGDAIQAILNRLDPHSVYIPPQSVADVNSSLKGNFYGVGIEFQIFDDTLNVVNVLADGPSAKAGVEVGDQLIKIGDSLVAGKKQKMENYRQLLRGENGSKVAMSLLRNGQLKLINVQRGIIPITSIDAAYMAAPGVGYIRINKFAEITFLEFMKAMDKLKPLGMQKLILDLRGNGGGYLEAAVNIADELIPDGNKIVYTEGAKIKRKDYKATKPGIFETGALVVLIDEMSASASEVLAGALQDNDRGTIVGRRSFGKGLVQEQFDLSNGGALRLTVARYYTPLGRSIQKPYSKGFKAYDDEVFNRLHGSDKQNSDSIYSLGKSYKTPKGKIVYDGGGITPDVYVAYDSTKMNTLNNDMYEKSTLQAFCYNYYIKNKATFTNFKNANAYDSLFSFAPTIWNNLVDFAKKDSINLTTASPNFKADVLLKLKSIMARQLYRNEGWYEVDNKTNATYKKALEILAKQ